MSTVTSEAALPADRSGSGGTTVVFVPETKRQRGD